MIRLCLHRDLGAAVQEPRRAVQQPAGGSKHEGQQENRCHYQPWNREALSVERLPVSHEQIERQVVYPSGEEQPAVAEERGHASQRRETALAVHEVSCNTRNIDKGEQRHHGNHDVDYPAGTLKQDKSHPCEQRRRVRDGENRVWSHLIPSLRQGDQRSRAVPPTTPAPLSLLPKQS